ncbi:MAG: VOC family protein [Myxococcales bacterium]|nr:VOC family protein [Myxococcales bacterium]
MKPPPNDWPRISSALYYTDPAKAIDWLCEAFGFEVRIKVVDDDGQIQHSELTLGGGLIMVAGEQDRHEPRVPSKSPRSIDGAVTQCLAIYVDDADALCERARAAGAIIASEPETTDHGEDYWADRGFRAVDPDGHHWWFMQRVRG